MGKGGVACNIPVIDMQDFPAQFGKLMEACGEWGFFRIINHGIPPALVGEMKAVSRSLLDLPVEIKMRNSNPVQGKGYTPPNMASPVSEGLGCYDMAVHGNLDQFLDQLCVSDPRQRYGATGDYIWSVKPRVQCYTGSIRVSIALFVLGPKNGVLEAPRLRITTRSPTGAIELLRIKS